MKRLTVRTPKGAALKLNSPQTEQEAREQLMEKYTVAIEKLAAYEDLEEQGRLVKIPCAVNDVVYLVLTAKDGSGSFVIETKVETVVKYGLMNRESVYNVILVHENFIFYRRFCDFGKEVFKTREAALAELERRNRKCKSV